MSEICIVIIIITVCFYSFTDSFIMYMTFHVESHREPEPIPADIWQVHRTGLQSITELAQRDSRSHKGQFRVTNQTKCIFLGLSRSPSQLQEIQTCMERTFSNLMLLCTTENIGHLDKSQQDSMNRGVNGASGPFRCHTSHVTISVNTHSLLFKIVFIMIPQSTEVQHFIIP